MDRLIDVVERRKLAFGGGADRDDNLDGFVPDAALAGELAAIGLL